MRIISGNYGGRPLKAVKGTNTRPTTDKTKESLFNIIGPYFNGGNVLDLYAGSGSLGIEAVSRGAEKAFLIDNDPAAIQTIKENVLMTKDENKFTILKMKDRHAIDKFSISKQHFDLVFMDPPYAKQELEDIIKLMIDKQIVNDQAMIICETDKKITLEFEIDRLKLYKEKVYGMSKITIYEWSSLDD